MTSNVDDVLIEQHSSRSEVSGGIPSSRRLLEWAQTDFWGAGEVSPTRQLAAWVALMFTLAMIVLLAMGY